jgi:hypothetical protein
MPFMVIGGHAVNAYGISRQTGDLDLLVPLRHRAQWSQLMLRIKYTAIQDDDSFARFSPPDLTAWPIDFMFVDDTTFEHLYSDSSLTTIGVAETRTVSARHLLILKIHALNQAQDHRVLKDLNDALGLLRAGVTGVTPEDLLALCSRYANHDVFDKLRPGLDAQCPRD